jgi:hypothetical protein
MMMFSISKPCRFVPPFAGACRAILPRLGALPVVAFLALVFLVPVLPAQADDEEKESKKEQVERGSSERGGGVAPALSLPLAPALLPPLTEVDVAALIKELETALASKNLDDAVNFYQKHLAEDAKIRTKVKMNYPGASEPVVNTLEFGKAQQIDGVRSARATLKAHSFELKVSRISVASNGRSAEVVYKGKEEAVITLPNGDPKDLLKTATLSQCTALLVPGPQAPLIASLSCDADFVAKF